MRFPRSSHAVAAALALLVLGVGVARSRTVVVDPGGSGDFTSIQAAIDSLFAWRTGGGPPDTAIVRAGTYEETITAHYTWGEPLQILCPDGPDITRVRGIAFPPYPYYSGYACALRGLAFMDRVATGSYPATYNFRNCLFAAGFVMPEFVSYGGLILGDCEFRDTTRIVLPPYGGFGGELTGALTGLHFKGTRAYVKTQEDGSGRLARCTFEGPGDTLLVLRAWTDVNVHLDDCTFRGAAVGIAKSAFSYPNAPSRIYLRRCTFDELSDVAIVGGLGVYGRVLDGIDIQNSVFRGCARAIDWRSGAGSCFMDSDTLGTTTPQAIRVASHRTELRNLVFESGTGGIAARVESWPNRQDEVPGLLTIGNCRWSNAAGTAIEVTDTLATPLLTALDITHNTILGAAGTGIVVRAPHGLIRGNVVASGGADGIALSPIGPLMGFTVDSNTVVRNTGDGIRVTDSFYQGPRLFRNNLVARNGGAGLAVGGLFGGSVAYNDAWQNSGGDYQQVDAPLDSNLSVNPLFCDASAGDYTLQFGSPCGAGGFYGLIGALPEACVSAVGAPAAPVTTAAFSIHPNPARGEVALTPPAAGGSGTIEVLDLQGRRVWSSAFRAGGAPIRWRGESSRGTAGAGLYWVRVARPEGVQSGRLVWLK